MKAHPVMRSGMNVFLLSLLLLTSCEPFGTYNNPVDPESPDYIGYEAEAATSVILSATDATCSLNRDYQLTATVRPLTAYQGVTWSSSNRNVATVSESGLVHGVAEGTTRITATSKSGAKTAGCNIRVQNIALTGLNLSPATAIVEVDKTITLSPVLIPSNASNQTLTWSSGSSSVATVSNSGVVTGVASGTATISAMNSTGTITAQSTITVYPAYSRSGLAGEWLFAGNANDTSTTVNHGSVSGATLTTDRFGQSNNAYSFNGTSDYIALGSSLPDMTKFSISAWVQNLAGTDAAAKTIFMDGTTTSGNDMVMQLDTAGKVYIRADKSGSALNSSVTGCVANNSWHHVVWSMAGSTSSVYFDGTLVSTVTQSGSNVGYHNTRPCFGRSYDGSISNSFFKGYLDDIRLYNRELTPTEVLSLYGEDIAQVPAAPDGLTALSNTDGTVTWRTSFNASSYNVYYAVGSTVTSATGTKAVSGTTNTWATISGLESGTQYAIIVTAVNPYGESTASSILTVTPVTD